MQEKNKNINHEPHERTRKKKEVLYEGAERQSTQSNGLCGSCGSWLKKIVIILLIFLIAPLYAQDADHLSAFSDPARIWGNGIERVIEEAYRQCFITRIIDGKIMNIRMPFAENNERNLLSTEEFNFLGGGKWPPDALWPVITETLDSQQFADYTDTISDGKEQVLIFDMSTQTWKSSRDLFDIARMKAGSYRGLPHRPYVLVSGQGIEETDVYNYLYCVSLVGMDCSGFVWFVLSYIAEQGGMDLGKVLSLTLGVPKGENPSWYVGTSFFSSKSSHIIQVKDTISGLKPADIILFRGADGNMAHSAVIQSVDFTKGIIRYLQCTDEAPLHERGVHESFVYFDPARPGVSLSDPSLNWTQKRYAPFPGEKDSPFSDDGERYRAFPDKGGGRVVRLRPLAPVIEKLNSRGY
ncbi:MAG: peptidoglycan endopeptidase [Treponema sp.]|nr:peptidoglycan endopeptidase [Treponema sp.]